MRPWQTRTLIIIHLQIKKILGDFVARDVILNASMLVEDLFNANLLIVGDIQNYYSSACLECGGRMKEVLIEIRKNHITSVSIATFIVMTRKILIKKHKRYMNGGLSQDGFINN